jgi:hypothetical protein
LICKFDPQLFKIDLKIFDELRILQNDQVFLVGSDCLTSPVEAARDEDLRIDETVLIVHVGVRVVVHGGGDTFKSQPPHISTVKLSTLIVNDQTTLHTLLEAVENRS